VVLNASAFNCVGAHEETFPSFLVLKKGPIGTTHAYKKDHCYQESMKTMHALSNSPLVIVIAHLRRDMGDSMSKVPGSNTVAIKAGLVLWQQFGSNLSMAPTLIFLTTLLR